MLQIFKKKVSKELGIFPLLEYLITNNSIINKNKRMLLLGDIYKDHLSLINLFGYNTEQFTKKEINSSFHLKKINKKYDVIFCNHVIQYQRNTGFFLDKLFDILKNNGKLIISGPKHSSEILSEGQISSCILPVFIQNLIYSGFDCKNGKMLSIGSFENSFIVSKENNFNKKERTETGFKWSESHKKRSPFDLVSGISVENSFWFFENCYFWKSIRSAGDFESKIARIVMTFPDNYRYMNTYLNIQTKEILELFEFIEFYDQDLKSIDLKNSNLRISL
ncbi:class I SAM-dependent methyltransferase [Rickettsiales bacterium]|nr:class I SAM-dependent methyltransferase [Rickettsiales bacterium]